MREKIILILAILTLESCVHNTRDNNSNNGREEQVVRGEQIDSIRLNVILNDALELVNENISSDNYFKEYEIKPDDSSYVSFVDIIIGHLFTNSQRNALIRRTVPWATYVTLYSISDGNINILLTGEIGPMSYVDDKIIDVNGDGYKDFLIHWYPSSGCCLRDNYSVYLNQMNNSFQYSYDFINPTFYPNEKIVRGIEYGHPGEIGLYKLKWNEQKIDTIEFIFPNVNNKEQFVKTKKRCVTPTEKDGVILEAVPKEYLNIENYNWFINY